MSSLNENSRHNYFSDQSAIQGFNLALSKYMSLAQKALVNQYLPKEGTLRLYHGNRWEHPANTEASNGGLTEHSYYSETKFQDIVDHKLELIGICVKELSDAMRRQFAEMIYSTVNDACEQTGNIVDAKGMPLADALISTIEKISFSTDKNGAVLFPKVHAHPDIAKKMIDAINTAFPEYKMRLEEVTERKSKEALHREAERKAKFVRYGEG